MSSRRPVRQRKTGTFNNDRLDWNHIEIGSESEDDDRPVKRAKGGQAGEQEPGTEHDVQLEAETAWAVGFNALGISEMEEGLLPPESNEAAYVQMRNHILARWRADVSRYLEEEEAVSKVPQDFKKYASLAWRFLNINGYINFGVAPAIWKRALDTPDTRGTVVVVGAGMAGLACARQLRAFGFKVIVLEGHDRPGGRVYTKKLEGGGLSAVGDLGGSILTGIDGNPLAVLCTQLRIPQHAISSSDVKLYMPDGQESDPLIDSAAEERHNEILEKCSAVRDEMGDVAANISLGVAYRTLFETYEPEVAAVHQLFEGGPPAPPIEKFENGNGRPATMTEEEVKAATVKRDMLNWHCANLEFANACEIGTLSMRFWDQDDPHELLGAHCFIPGGNIRLVAAMAEGLPVLYNSVVREIRYSSSGVAVRTDMHEFAADAVVVTAPLGVLKRDIINFVPPLPARKREAIQRVNFGVLNKLVLLFPRAFWGNCDMFGYVNNEPEKRGDFFLFYSYAHLAGGPLLAGLVSGKAALEYENQSPKEAVIRVMRVLRRIFEPKGITVPMPVQACCTRWGSDPMAFGSYSSLGVGSLGGEDYDTLAESLSGRVFFAGEATTRKFPATMHGAFHTGLREAANVSAAIAKRQAEAAAAAQAKAEGVNRQVSMQNQEIVQKALETSGLAARLGQYFGMDGFVPDVEFGCFTAVFGPKSCGMDNMALLRMDVGNAQQGGQRKALPVFVALSRQDVLRLQDTEGGDAARFTALITMDGIKPVGRNHMDPKLHRLIHAILYPERPLPSAHALNPASAAASAPPPAPAPQASAAAPPTQPLPPAQPPSRAPASALPARPAVPLGAAAVSAPPTATNGRGPAPLAAHLPTSSAQVPMFTPAQLQLFHEMQANLAQTQALQASTAGTRPLAYPPAGGTVSAPANKQPPQKHQPPNRVPAHPQQGSGRFQQQGQAAQAPVSTAHVPQGYGAPRQAQPLGMQAYPTQHATYPRQQAQGPPNPNLATSMPHTQLPQNGAMQYSLPQQQGPGAGGPGRAYPMQQPQQGAGGGGAGGAYSMQQAQQGPGGGGAGGAHPMQQPQQGPGSGGAGGAYSMQQPQGVAHAAAQYASQPMYAVPQVQLGQTGYSQAPQQQQGMQPGYQPQQIQQGYPPGQPGAVSFQSGYQQQGGHSQGVYVSQGQAGQVGYHPQTQPLHQGPWPGVGGAYNPGVGGGAVPLGFPAPDQYRPS